MDHGSQIIARLKIELLALNYPWPEALKGKDQKWLESELRLVRSSGHGPQENQPSG
jgi:hypothetical protein